MFLSSPPPAPFLLPLPGRSDPALWAAYANKQHRAVWLDGDGGRSARGRFSFLTWNPHRVLSAWGDRLKHEWWEPGLGCVETKTTRGDPLVALAELLAEEAAPTRTPPVPFASGTVLALGFEIADWIERLPPVRPHRGPHADIPDLSLACYDSVMVFDEVAGRGWLAGRRPRTRRTSGVLSTLSEAAAQGRFPPESAPAAGAPPPETARRVQGKPAQVPPAYAAAVATIHEHLARGDVYQVNLSWPLRAPWPAPPMDLYLAHRRMGRVPHGAFLDLGGDHALACFSPERFLARRGLGIMTCPIKGTRPRGATAAADRAEMEKLRSSAKDCAEHIMIVDLERNDLGRVCVAGSIHVDPMLGVESYPSVHHLVSTVHGTLRPDAGPVDLLRATFPSGSITGAPKIRAIEILRALEGEPRHLYTGAIGYCDAGGDLDLAIAIRTALLSRGQLEYRVGGGIVIDSDAASEYRETLDKAHILERVLGEARPAKAASEPPDPDVARAALLKA